MMLTTAIEQVIRIRTGEIDDSAVERFCVHRTNRLFVSLQFCVALLLLGTAHNVIAQSSCPDRSDSQPAMLVNTEEQQALRSNLSPGWKSGEPGRLIRFGAYIGRNGHPTGFCCMSSSIKMNPSTERSLANRLAGLRFTPARHDGKDMRVFVGFTIIARKSETGIQSTLLLNNLLSSDQFGARYIAPQRIRGDTMWADGIRIDGPIWAELMADVDRTGTASNGRVRRWETGQRSTEKRLNSKFQNQCFIPGRFEGAAVAMPYAEVLQR